jgi:hypothetical protein
MTAVSSQLGRARRPGAVLWIVLLGFAALYGLLSFPVDDGLRHVAFAFSEAADWGHIYPFSIYQQYPGYDPWYGYDLLLRGLAHVVALLPVSTLLQQLLVTRLVSVGLLVLFVALCLERSRLASQVEDARGLALACAVALVLLAEPLPRIGLIRPFAFGTLYVLYVTRARGALRGALSSALLALLYPYLAWLYILPAAVATLVCGSRAFALGALAVLAGSTLLQPSGFWALVGGLIRAADIRNVPEAQVTEFDSLLAAPYLLVSLLAAGLLVAPRLTPEERKLRPEHVMILLFLPYSLRYIRYFLDVVLPLLFVAYAAPLTRILREPFDTALTWWQGVLLRALPGRRRSAQAPREPARVRGGELALPALYGAALLGLVVWINALEYDALDSFRRELDVVPQREIVLTDFNLQYQLLYARPDLRLVPSPTMGTEPEDLKREFDAFYRGAVCGLAHRIGVGYFAENGKSLRPERTPCLTPVPGARSFQLWRVGAAKEEI